MTNGIITGPLVVFRQFSNGGDMMKTFCIVNADNGEIVYKYTIAPNLQTALIWFAVEMPHALYKYTWNLDYIGSAPYIFTDNGTRITGYECD